MIAQAQEKIDAMLLKAQERAAQIKRQNGREKACPAEYFRM